MHTQALRLCEFEYFCDVIALSVLLYYIISQLLHYTTWALMTSRKPVALEQSQAAHSTVAQATRLSRGH